MSEARKTNLPAPALPRENFKRIKEARNLEELFTSAEFRERIVASVPKHVTNDRILSVVLRAHTANPLLLQATPQSFAGACLTATNTGLEPNSALSEAHLIPFKQKGRVQIQVIFGYQGLLKLVDNTGRVITRSANIVYPDSDVFDWMEGSETFLKFKRGGRRERRDDDRPSHAFFHAKLSGGGEYMEVWPYGDVLRIRNMSQGYRRALAARDEAAAENKRPPATFTAAPWVAHEEAMARKTMIRAGVKYLPKSVELANAARLDEVQDRRDIDYSRVIDVAGNEESPDYTGAAAMLGEQGGDDDGGGWTPGGGGGNGGGGGGADPGATFTDRRQGSVDSGSSQQTPNRSQETQQPAGNGGAPAPSPRSPSFEHYLIDDAGEYEGPFVDPVEWAKAFIAMRGRISDMPTFLENNEDALAAARQAPIADQLLDVQDEKRDLPAPVTLAVANRRDGKPDWADYANGFRHILFGWRGDLTAWFEAQRGMMERAPLATRLALLKAARERAQQLNAGLPEWLAGLAGPTKKPDKAPDGAANATPNAPVPSPENRPDIDERWVADTVAHINAQTTSQAVSDYCMAAAVQTRMKRLRAEKPELWAKVDAATVEKLKTFQAPPPSGAPPANDDPGNDGEEFPDGPA